jgi:hypothetical protein
MLVIDMTAGVLDVAADCLLGAAQEASDQFLIIRGLLQG